MANQNLIIGGIVAAGGLLYLRASAEVSPGVEPGFGTSTVPPNAPQTVLQWKGYALEAGATYNVSPQLVLAVIWQESYGNPGAVGSAGEVGLMQITDGAAADVGFVQAVSDPKSNIWIGTAYLRKQYERWQSRNPDLRDALLWFHATRAYNAGFYGSTLSEERGRQYALEVFQKAGWEI